MAAALPFVGPALTLVGGALSISGQLKQGKAEKKEAYRQAAVDEENARLAVYQGEIEAADIRREQRRKVGASLAQISGNGLMLDQTVGALIEQSAFEGELDVARIRDAAAADSRNYRLSAEARRISGDQAKSAAKWGAISTGVSTLSQVVSQVRLGQQGKASG